MRLMAKSSKRVLAAVAVCGMLAANTSASGSAAAPRLLMWRLACGAIKLDNLDLFSDTFVFHGRPGELTDSCYLIRHGRDYMLWETGFGTEMLGNWSSIGPGGIATLDRTLASQLQQIGLQPSDITLIGISHSHGDHTGQARLFAKARLYIGAPDFDESRKAENKDGNGPLRPWTSGASPVEPVIGDRDIFGDRSVIMLATPGHTAGHHSLLVHLQKTGSVLLSGDLYHLKENRLYRTLPPMNFSRADTLASMDRVEGLVKTMGARLVIEHEPADIAKLPAFPKAAD